MSLTDIPGWIAKCSAVTLATLTLLGLASIFVGIPAWLVVILGWAAGIGWASYKK